MVRWILVVTVLFASTTAKDYLRAKHYEFEADTLEGDIARPMSDTVTGRVEPKHPSLIRVRTAFVREIVKSAEDL